MELYRIIGSIVIGYFVIGAAAAGLLIRGLLPRFIKWMVEVSGDNTEDSRIRICKASGLVFPLVVAGHVIYWTGYLIFKVIVYNFFWTIGAAFSLLVDYLGTSRPKKVKLPKARVIGDD